MLRGALTVTMIVVLACAAPADEKDPVKDKLFAAKVAYEKELQQYHKQSTEWFDKREEVARKDGNKKQVDQLKGEREAFDVTGELPKSAPAALRQKSAVAKKALEAAYAQAVKDYVRAKKDAEAAAVEEAWKTFVNSTLIDLLALVDTKSHTVVGEWKKDEKALIGVSGRIQLPYEPGDEYDIDVTLRRAAGDDCFAIGLVAGGRQFLAIIDSWPPAFAAGLEQVDKKSVADNETLVKGELLKAAKSHTITCAVRTEKIVILVDGKSVSEFKGEFTRLSLVEAHAVPNKKALFFHLGPNTSFQIERAVVRPVKGKGTVLK